MTASVSSVHSWAAVGVLLHWQANGRTESCTVVPFLVFLHESGEPELARAMRGRDTLQMQLVMKYGHHALDFLIRRCHEVETADRAIEPGLDPCCRRENFLDARVGAADNDGQALWRAH